jgi:hypothetical protein
MSADRGKPEVLGAVKMTRMLTRGAAFSRHAGGELEGLAFQFRKGTFPGCDRRRNAARFF